MEQVNNKLEVNQQKTQMHIQARLNPRLYTLFRLDGHSFSKFVKQFNMNLPFDKNFTQSMQLTAMQCMTYFKFCMGFVGSDQITFVMKPLTQEQIKNNSVLQFNGRVQKMVSLLAGKLSTIFFIQLTKLQGFQKTSQFSPHFDCRAIQLTSFTDVISNISQRVTFTLKNSRMMLAQTYFSAKQLNKVSSREAVQKLLKEKQINFEDFVPVQNRVGSIIIFQKSPQTKVINVKGEQKQVTFDRKKTKLLNLSPTQVLKINEIDLI